MHRILKIDYNLKQFAESINFYSYTKWGVGILDDMSGQYTTRSA